ncbi:MAG: hypothetical protein U9N53_13030 [Bacteroidota bacterium]|nr:hypothetical protein [Bacteroidota bacterium]
MKLLEALREENQIVLFEMEDGSIKSLDEVKDFHQVKIALKPQLIKELVLTELFGSDPLSKSKLKKKHMDSFISLLKLVVDLSNSADLKNVAKKYHLRLKTEGDGDGKIASELLRE